MYTDVSKILPKYYIGRIFFTKRPLPSPGSYYFYKEQEHLNTILLPEDDLSGQIRANFLYRPAEFAISMRENILLFLSRFHNQAWNISPYHYHYFRSKEQFPKDEFVKLRYRDELQVLLINQALGSVQGVRTVRLSSEFATCIHNILQEQESQDWMDKVRYNQAMGRIQETYFSPDDLLAITDSRILDAPTPPSWLLEKEEEANDSI